MAGWAGGLAAAGPRRRGSYTCNYWGVATSSYEGQLVKANGVISTSWTAGTSYGCNDVRPVACCQ